MKSVINVSLCLLFFLLFSLTSRAQDEARNKLQMSISYGGKTITASLLSASTSLTRYSDDYDPPVIKDSAGGKGKPAEAKHGSFYLSLVIKKVSPELLQAFAKRDNRFDGTITITDTYGKNPDKTISFKGGSMESYSDQFSGAEYNDNYYGTSVTIICKSLILNGVEIEQ